MFRDKTLLRHKKVLKPAPWLSVDLVHLLACVLYIHSEITKKGPYMRVVFLFYIGLVILLVGPTSVVWQSLLSVFHAEKLDYIVV